MDDLIMLNEEREELPQAKIDVGKNKRTFSQLIIDFMINFIKGLPKSLIIGAITVVIAGLMAEYIPLFHGISSFVFSLIVSLVVLAVSIMTMLMRRSKKKRTGQIKTICFLMLVGLVMFNLNISVFAEVTDYYIGEEENIKFGPHDVVYYKGLADVKGRYILPSYITKEQRSDDKRKWVDLYAGPIIYSYYYENGLDYGLRGSENYVESSNITVPYISFEQLPDSGLSASEDNKKRYKTDNICNISGLDFLTSVTIEDGYTSIGVGGSGFKENKNLTSVQIPDSVTIIDQAAFSDCPSLKNLNLPKNLSLISDTAFMYSGITKPFHIHTEQQGCVLFNYTGCDNIKVISLPECTKEASQYNYMQSLQLISIPKGATNIHETCMNPNLKAVVVYNDKIKITDYEGIERNAFILNPDQQPVSIKHAFDGCPNLTIYCNAGSNAAKYAEKYDIPWKPINQLPKELKELENENTPDEIGNTDDPSNPGKTPPKPGDPDYRYDPDDPDNPYPPENKNKPIPTGVETTLLTAAELALLEAIRKKMLKAGYTQTEDGHFWRTETGKDQTIIYEYNEKGELLGRSKNKADGTSERTNYTLDSDGKITQTITTKHSPDGTTSNKVEFVKYDQNGNITTERTVNTDKPTYDSNGNPDYQTVEQRWYDSDGHSYRSESYYENGQLKQIITENTNYEQQTGDVLGGQIGNRADYDINNQLITTTVNYGPDGTVTSTVDTTYIKVDIGNGKTQLVPQGQVMK